MLKNDSDPDNGDVLKVTTFDELSTLGGAVSISEDGAYSYNPAGSNTLQELAVGESTVDSFTYTAGDPHGLTDQATVSITVSGVNDQPVASPDTTSTDEDSLHSVSAQEGVLANDRDVDRSDQLKVSTYDEQSALGAAVTVSEDGSYTYDPSRQPLLQSLGSGASTVDSFTYNISDGQGGTASSTVTVNVIGLNDLPTASLDEASTSEDVVLTVSTPGVLINDSDIDVGDVLKVTSHDELSTLGAKVSVNEDGSFSYDPTTASLLQALASRGSTVDAFQYKIDDGHGGTAETTVRVTVLGANDPPVAGDDDYSIDEDNILTVAAPGPLMNDVDPDNGSSLSVSASESTSALGAAVSVDEDGRFTYDATMATQLQGLAVGESTVDSFTYTVRDPDSATGTATVRITVSGVNDLPMAVDDSGAVWKNQVLQVDVQNGVLQNDSDIDLSDTLTVSAFDALSEQGAKVTVNADGSFSYDPRLSQLLQLLDFGDISIDKFTYTASDGKGGTARAVVYIAVKGEKFPLIVEGGGCKCATVSGQGTSTGHFSFTAVLLFLGAGLLWRRRRRRMVVKA